MRLTLIRSALPMLIVVLAACGGGTPAPSPTPTICPEIPVIAPPTLLYPIDHSTNTPDGNFTLVVGSGAASPPPPVLVPANGGMSVTGGTAVPPPSPLPSPAATPLPGETVYGFPIPALQPATTYAVTFTFGPIIPSCTGPETSGQFTTK
jgi:hypothetical protein